MLDPLDTLPEWTGQYRTLGWQVAEWAATRFVVPDGPKAGELLELSDRQLVFLLHWYSLDEQGQFVYTGAAMRHSRGSGKSPLMALLACAELVGPVRFGGWADDGDPIGKRVSMPLVQLAAVSQDQTDHVMRYCQAWLAKGSPLQQEYELDPGKQIIHAPGHGGAAGGSLRIITSSAATVRGARPTAVFADETGEWDDRNGGSSFRARLGENAAKVAGSRIVEASNVWVPGRGSVAERRWESWQQQREQTGSSTFLMDVREAPADANWSDADSIREALQAVYSPSPWQNPEGFMPTILDPGKPVEESQREFGNLRVSDLSSWVSAQDWDTCADATASLADGDDVVLFCDPSDTDDATALVACRLSDGLVEPLWIHEPTRSISIAVAQVGRLEPAELDRQVMVAFERFTVRALFADVHPTEQLVKDTWPTRYGDELLVWATSSEPVAFDMRKGSTAAEFAAGAELVADEIAQHAFTHTGDSALSRHVYNAIGHPYKQYRTVTKPERARKIDACVSMIGARIARNRVLASKEWANLNRKRSGLVW